MRWLAIAGVLLATAGVAVAGVKAGERAADFNLRGLDGSEVKLAELRGQVVVLDFWASWCGPCKKELPALDGLARKWADAKRPVVVLAVSIDKERGNAEKFLASAKVGSLKIALDPDGKVASAYDVPTMPSSYVIDPHGLVKAVHAGFSSGDERAIADEVDAALTEK
jgi:peroxiredoxin